MTLGKGGAGLRRVCGEAQSRCTGSDGHSASEGKSVIRVKRRPLLRAVGLVSDVNEERNRLMRCEDCRDNHGIEKERRERVSELVVGVWLHEDGVWAVRGNACHAFIQGVQNALAPHHVLGATPSS